MYHFFKMRKETSPIDLTNTQEVIGAYAIDDTIFVVVSQTDIGVSASPNSYPDVSLISTISSGIASELTGYSVADLTLGSGN